MARDKYRRKVWKQGDSLAMTIPSEMCKEKGITEGCTVRIKKQGIEVEK